MRKSLLVLAIAAAAMPLSAQQPTFRAGTQLVSVFATVTDTEKRLVPNLEQQDFEVARGDA